MVGLVKIYTAGEMDKNDDDCGYNYPKPHMLFSSKNWRYKLEGYLNMFGAPIEFLHPKLGGCDHFGLDAQETVCKDTKLIFESDAVIAYLNRPELHATIVELMYANQIFKPILILIDPGLTSDTFTGGHSCSCMFQQDEDEESWMNPYWFLLYNLKIRSKKFQVRVSNIKELNANDDRLYKIIKSFLEYAKLISSDYTKYITSPEWKNKSKEFKNRNNGFCSLCNTCVGIENLETHHKKYPKDFKHDTENNWIAICKVCHAKLHGMEP